MAGAAKVAAGAKSARWSTHFAFIMATIGCSVGLGNFWRFPYTAGESGGGWFVAAYLVCVIFVALPLLIAELAIGRRARLSAVSGMAFVARENGAGGWWGIAGLVGMLASFTILTFYSVIAGWVIDYIPASLFGVFDGKTPDEISAVFGELTGEEGRSMALLGHAIFMGITAAIVAFGVKAGIERAVSLLMPAFFIMLVIVVGWSMATGAVGEALEFLFKPRGPAETAAIMGWEEVPSNAVFYGGMWQKALGQAFFSIGVGAALMITYGAYVGDRDNLGSSGVQIAFADTLVAILAGLAIFPLVFQYGQDPAAGPGLFFMVLPNAFAQMPFGWLFGGVFFTLAFFAALTSSISILEVVTAYFEEFMPRPLAAALIAFAAFAIGAFYIFDLRFIDVADYFSGDVGLPVGGFLIAIFAGWVVSRQFWSESLPHMSAPMRGIWLMLVRYVAPIGVLAILFFGASENFNKKVSPVFAPADAAPAEAPEGGG